jgi:WD40 repeat protein
MLYCLNPECKQPVNAVGASHCAACGSRLTGLLRGRYRILRQLGRGGFGKTFLAVDEDRLQARCVIKQFSPQGKGTDALEKAVQLFEQEAIRLDELGEHPQIPTLLAYFEHEQRLYLVQQFVEGQTLLEELAAQGAFDEAKIREVLTGILPILRFIHERHVIHRDITPANIIRRSGDQKLVLIDFGVAKVLTANTFGLPGTKIGTEGYAPIEQLRNGKAYPASDLYSLGVTCLYLLTSTKPEDLYDPLRGRWQWREKLAERQRQLSDGVGSVLDVMVRDLVAERFPSALAAMQSLRSALEQPVTEPPVTPTTRPPAPGMPPDVPNSQQTIVQRTPIVDSTVLPAPPPSGQRPVSPLPPISHPVSVQTMVAGGPVGDYPCLANLKGHSSWVLALAVSPDARTVVSSGLDDRIIVWDLQSRQARLVINDAHSKPINSLAITPDGQFLISGSDDDTIKVWQMATGQLVRVLSGHTGDVNSVMTTIDGQFIISGSEDRTVTVWRRETGDRLRNFPGVTALIKTTAISLNGEYIAAGGSDRQISVWNLNSGHLVQTLTGHLGAIQSVAVSAEGRFVVSGSKDRTIRIWIPRSGELVRTLVKHLDAVNAVAVTPDSRAIISGSTDKTVRVWRLPTGELLATLNQHNGAINAIAISPNQRWFVSGGSDGQIYVWQLAQR